MNRKNYCYYKSQYNCIKDEVRGVFFIICLHFSECWWLFARSCFGYLRIIWFLSVSSPLRYYTVFLFSLFNFSRRRCSDLILYSLEYDCLKNSFSNKKILLLMPKDQKISITVLKIKYGESFYSRIKALYACYSEYD